MFLAQKRNQVFRGHFQLTGNMEIEEQTRKQINLEWETSFGTAAVLVSSVSCWSEDKKLVVVRALD